MNHDEHTTEATTYDRITDRIIALALAEPRVRALWIEADAREKLRRPYPGLEVHVAADAPQFPGLVADLERLLASHLAVTVDSIAGTQRLAERFAVRLGERSGGALLPVTIIVEQSCYLAKRPRAWVVPLEDRTGHLCHVMDFSARRRT